MSPAGGAETPQADTPLADAPRRGLLPLGWPLFTAVWLLFPASFVIQELRRGLGGAGALALLASVAALAAIFLWLMLRYPCWASGPSKPGRRIRTGLLLGLAALALYVELVYAGGVPHRLTFVALAAAVTLPTQPAAWAVGAVTVVAGVIYALRSEWDGGAALGGASDLLPIPLVGLGMILVSRLVLTIRELRAARGEIARLAVAEERLRFARDLHDLLGHSLSQITLKSELAGRLLPPIPETERAAKEIREVEGAARKSLGEVRQAVAGYRQPTLDGECRGAREMLGAAGISCWIENPVGVLPSGTGADAVLAWAVREGVTNVIRHSRASRCEIRLGRDGERVYAEIQDDGYGSPLEPEGARFGGSGLSGLAERVSRRGGDLEAGALPAGGFRLRVDLPLGKDRAPAAGSGSGAGGRR